MRQSRAYGQRMGRGKWTNPRKCPSRPHGAGWGRPATPLPAHRENRATGPGDGLPAIWGHGEPSRRRTPPRNPYDNGVHICRSVAGRVRGARHHTLPRQSSAKSPDYSGPWFHVKQSPMVSTARCRIPPPRPPRQIHPALPTRRASQSRRPYPSPSPSRP